MINHSNYETWFLLYADNELSAVEKEAVLSFVKKNPLLAVEFELATRLKFMPPNDIKLNDKKFLSAEFFESKLETALKESEEILNFIDNEISGEASEKLKLKIKTNDALSLRFSEFLDLKLQADHSITFREKSSLYRHSPSHKIVWLRPLLAAASILLIVGISWFFYENETDEKTLSSASVSVDKSNVIKKIEPIQIDLESNKTSLELSKVRLQRKSQIIKKNFKVISQVDNDKALVSKEESPLKDQDATKIIATEAPISEPYKADPMQVAEPVYVNSAASVNSNELPSSYFLNEEIREGKKTPFRGILRKLNRMMGKDRPESDQIKFIQVANIQLAIAQ